MRGTQHTASTAPCGADRIAKNNQRLGPRPVGGQPDPMLTILWGATFARGSHPATPYPIALIN